ncbi:MAG: hypothetical protein ACKN9V_00600 [Pseudomonadota bacterium]
MMFSPWKLPSQFTLARIEKLLNRYSQEAFDKAFRFIGVEEDFFHGHVLFERKSVNGEQLLHPRAILYHTQEEAYKAHWEKSIDPKYDYLNVTTRNWIQWLSDDASQDGVKVENAREYLDVSKKTPSQFYDDQVEPQRDLHYTIHAKNLDSKKLGFELAGELQFEFFAIKDSPYSNERQIEIKLLEESVSLNLFTNTMYIERGRLNN